MMQDATGLPLQLQYPSSSPLATSAEAAQVRRDMVPHLINMSHPPGNCLHAASSGSLAERMQSMMVHKRNRRKRGTPSPPDDEQRAGEPENSERYDTTDPTDKQKRSLLVDLGEADAAHAAFFDGLGWTVESLVEGLDLQVKSAVDPSFFEKVPRLKLVARGVLGGLALLEEAGIVHNDLKPDNIVWVEGPSGTSTVRIIDFNCARLDNRQSPGQNWNVREGGIGCRAYCSPEMALGLPVTHSSDVWSLAVVLTELYSRRPSSLVLCCDHEAVQVSIAQALGLCNMAEGIPSSFLLKSPLTLNRNFTPAFTTVRGHLPLRQNQNADMEALRPVQFGLGHVFGSKTDDEANLLRDFLEVCLVWDGLHRPTAKKLLTRSGFLGRGAAKASSVKRAAKPP
ncbi:Dual specificity protein kinase lkh1 [Symbiodinium microadriaticum]|uniref:Dual specificity protein kinase lkh1 n=1 Tax=Symbiodinium microadriaticum TaxID=2951 RepID=A0A1Q9CIH2_SYMMI|nr:Dual specificity protein kinase lkh1 [Symbiodinium microadriaticum]